MVTCLPQAAVRYKLEQVRIDERTNDRRDDNGENNNDNNNNCCSTSLSVTWARAHTHTQPTKCWMID